jgi:hypothetical protein
MQRDEVFEFLAKIDQHLGNHRTAPTEKFELKIIGKSALLLAGLVDTVGTVDIDSLGVEGKQRDQATQVRIDLLLKEFGRIKQTIHGYYLEFVSPAIVFLPQKPIWLSLEQEFAHLKVRFLDPQHVVASKLFSAFSKPARKRDKQDIVAALDQGLVNFQTTLDIADQIFELHAMDGRSERFPNVHAYITEDLMSKYGKARLKYAPDQTS